MSRQNMSQRVSLDAATLDDSLQPHLEKGNTAPVYAWLERGGHVDARDSKGRTLLMLAAAIGNEEIVRAMVSCGAAIDMKQHQGTTALMFA
eukprot:5776973-Prymnesium_polylepis.1